MRLIVIGLELSAPRQERIVNNTDNEFQSLPDTDHIRRIKSGQDLSSALLLKPRPSYAFLHPDGYSHSS